MQTLSEEIQEELKTLAESYEEDYDQELQTLHMERIVEPVAALEKIKAKYLEYRQAMNNAEKFGLPAKFALQDELDAMCGHEREV